MVLSTSPHFFFLFLVGWDWVSWYCSHYWPIVPARWWVMVEKLVEWRLEGETKVLWENLPQRHSVHHKFHLTRPGPPLELWHGLSPHLLLVQDLYIYIYTHTHIYNQAMAPSHWIALYSLPTPLCPLWDLHIRLHPSTSFFLKMETAMHADQLEQPEHRMQLNPEG
jgi:hypothetical protein